MGIPTDKEITENLNDIINKSLSSGWDFWRRKEVQEGFRFYYGLEQWNLNIVNDLRNKGLTPITMNRIPPFVNSVAGEITRLSGEAHFFATDTRVSEEYAEIANEGTKWARSKSKSDYFDKLVLKDAIICGLGIKEQIVDYETNMNGLPRDYRVPPHLIIPDFSAKGANIEDGEFVVRADFLSDQEFERKFPEFVGSRTGAGAEFLFLTLRTSREANFNKVAFFSYADHDAFKLDENLVLDFQFRDKEAVLRMENPLLNEDSGLVEKAILNPGLEQFIVEEILVEFDLNPQDKLWILPKDKAKELKENFQGLADIPSQETHRNRIRRAFTSGGHILDKGDAPFEDKFSYNFIVGLWDDMKQCPYFLGRMLRDPQRVTNASFMHIFQGALTAPKATIIAKKGITDDPGNFEQRVARSESVVWVGDDANFATDIFDIKRGAVPSGFTEPHNIGVTAFQDVSGINFSFTGLDGQEITGVLDRQRNEKSTTALGEVIDNFRFYLMECAKGDLNRLKELSENVPGKTIRILGENGVKNLQLLEDVFSADYDAIIDEIEASVSMQQETAKMFAEMLKTGVVPQDMQGEILDMILEMSPIPQSKINELRESRAQKQQAAAQKAQQDQPVSDELNQLLLAQTQADIRESIANAESKTADAQMKQAKIPQIQADAIKTFEESQQVALENDILAATPPGRADVNIP